MLNYYATLADIFTTNIFILFYQQNFFNIWFVLLPQTNKQTKSY